MPIFDLRFWICDFGFSEGGGDFQFSIFNFQFSEGGGDFRFSIFDFRFSIFGGGDFRFSEGVAGGASGFEMTVNSPLGGTVMVLSPRDSFRGGRGGPVCDCQCARRMSTSIITQVCGGRRVGSLGRPFRPRKVGRSRSRACGPGFV